MYRVMAQLRQLWAERLANRSGISAIVLLGLLLSGCGQPFWLPPAHKIEIQQGNLISEAQRESVAVGSSRDQVLNALGQPLSDNNFHQNRWDYVYTRGPAGSAIVARRLTLYFENDIVTKLTDNYAEESGEVPIRKPWWSRIFRSG